MQEEQVAHEETIEKAITVEAIEAATSVAAETPTTVPSETLSEHMSTQPTTPSSAVAVGIQSQQTPTQSKPSRVAMPVVPIIPAMPVSPVSVRKGHRDSVTSARSKTETDSIATGEEESKPELTIEHTQAPIPAPKSWADLVRKQSASNGVSSGVNGGLPVINGLSVPKSESLGEVLGEINTVEIPSKVVFLRPRGLVNTGNMCYMNSVTYSLRTLRITANVQCRYFKFLSFVFRSMIFWIGLLRKLLIPSRAQHP